MTTLAELCNLSAEPPTLAYLCDAAAACGLGVPLNQDRTLCGCDWAALRGGRLFASPELTDMILSAQGRDEEFRQLAGLVRVVPNL